MKKNYLTGELTPDTLTILCPYCSAPYTAKMETDLDFSQGCETCGHGGGMSGTIEIHCDNCKKLVYKKEYER